MFKRVGSHSDSMLLALVVWLCSLPLVLLIVAPLLGLKAAGLAALALSVAVLLICWGVCSWKTYSDQIR